MEKIPGCPVCRVSLAVITLQLMFEGERFQMWPAYFITFVPEGKLRQLSRRPSRLKHPNLVPGYTKGKPTAPFATDLPVIADALGKRYSIPKHLFDYIRLVKTYACQESAVLTLKPIIFSNGFPGSYYIGVASNQPEPSYISAWDEMINNVWMDGQTENPRYTQRVINDATVAFFKKQFGQEQARDPGVRRIRRCEWPPAVLV